MTQIQYNCIVSLDKFMMNADIKLFMMGLGYTTFDELNAKEVRACLNMLELKDTKFRRGGKFRSRATMIYY
jgi:hypothetical protein